MNEEVINTRINNFILKMEEIFECDKPTFKKLFKPRKSDYYFLAYDQECKVYAVSHNGEDWFKNGIGKFDYFGHVTIPARGSIWSSKKTKSLFLVTDFINIQSRKSNDQVPSVVYVNERGYSMSMPVVNWHAEMTYGGIKVK